MEKKSQLQEVLCNCEATFAEKVYCHMVTKANVSNSEICMPRVCGRQTQRQNYDASTPEMYYRVSVFQPYLTDIIAELDRRHVAK